MSELDGRRVLITGAARGIGAATARRLHSRGARLALLGIEPEELQAVARECGDAPALQCDVRNRAQVEAAVETAVARLGGLDVVMANAGVAAQLPILGGDASVFERTVEVNLLGVYYTLRATAPHIAHEGGYALAVSSLAAAVHPPLLGAYCASKAGVEALANALRAELHSSGARVGVAYFGELETDMTERGFGTEAAAKMTRRGGPFHQRHTARGRHRRNRAGDHSSLAARGRPAMGRHRAPDQDVRAADSRVGLPTWARCRARDRARGARAIDHRAARGLVANSYRPPTPI